MSNKTHKTTIPIQTFGTSFSKRTLDKLDKIRGDIPRSKYLQRLVEKHLGL